jgi:hypothetical protein
MSPKRLLPLLLILLVLGGLAFLLKRSPAPPQLADEVGLESLAPQTLRADSISGLDFYLGAKPQESVQLRKRENVWVVTSRFDTPGNSTKIQPLLTQLSALQGELRADSTALLGDFQLGDEQALHLKAYTDNTEKPAVHLLAGKGSGSNGFMRRDGEAKVYSVNLHLQSTAGLSSSATDQALTAKPWLDLRIQNVPKEQVSAVELHAPMRDLRFTTDPAATTPAWKLAAPELKYTVKPDAVEGLVTSLRTAQGDDVADPAKLAEYGLETPPYQATLTVQASGQEARQVALRLGNEMPDKNGSRYARLGETGPVYVVPQWFTQRLFPTLGTLLDLHIVQVAEQDVVGITLQEDDITWSLTRQTSQTTSSETMPAPAATWHLADNPESTVDTAAVTSLLAAATQLTADDLPASLPTQTGLERPHVQLTLTLHDGHTARVLLGQAVENGNGYYASRGDPAEVLVITTTIHKTLTEAVEKLKPSSTTTTTAPPKSPAP